MFYFWEKKHTIVPHVSEAYTHWDSKVHANGKIFYCISFTVESTYNWMLSSYSFGL